MLRPCAWQHVLGDDDVKALPNDGTPIAEFDDHDTGWLEVYEGIKRVLEHLRNRFTPRSAFLQEIERTEFVSQRHISLRDLYVFPIMTHIDIASKSDTPTYESIESSDAVLRAKWNLIHGDDRIGKTALARYLYLKSNR